MNAGAGPGGVEDDAGEGMDVIGEAGARIGCEGCRGWSSDSRRGRCVPWRGYVSLSRGESGEAEGRELKADAVAEGEGEVFLEELLAGAGKEVRPGVVAAVCGIDEDEGVIEGEARWSGRGRCGIGRVLSGESSGSGGDKNTAKGEMACRGNHFRC